jgi:hypothetical protein
MLTSVKAHIVVAMEDYVQTKRTLWAKRWPAMVVLAVSSIFWSQVRPPRRVTTLIFNVFVTRVMVEVTEAHVHTTCCTKGILSEWE